MRQLREFTAGRASKAGVLAGVVVVVSVLASACGQTVQPQAVPATTATTAAKPADGTTPTSSTTSTTSVDVPLSSITDPGLPSQVGPGPLTAPVVKKLMQYFETQTAAAYASGNGEALDPYLAGGMLTGNKGTINVLNGQNRRNIYKINVTKVSLDNNEADRVVFDLTGNMVTDYYEDTTTNQPVADGLPGPSTVNFLVFFDFNPTNHTWYWTGEQNESDSDTGSSGGATG